MPGLRLRFVSLCVSLFMASTALLRADDDMQTPAALNQPPLTDVVRYAQPVIAIEHVRVIDGTGAAPREDQTVVIDHGKIAAVGASASVAVPAGAAIVDGQNRTLTPGFVGTHNHLYYVSGGPLFVMREMPYSFPRMYLAGGVTTIRTAGSVEAQTDVRVKNAIDHGDLVGPHIDVTSPYMTGDEPYFLQMGTLRDPADAKRTVDFYADHGITSFKVYTNVSPEIVRAVIAEAHALHLRVLGHLCSIGFRDAAAMGFDSLEHGISVDTEFFPGKEPGLCPHDSTAVRTSIANLDLNRPDVQSMIHELVAHHVALSSTLPVLEVPKPDVEARVLDVLDAQSKIDLTKVLARTQDPSPQIHARFALTDALVAKEMAFERAYYQAGGLLTNGPDPTGSGASIAGFGDQRGMELLVQAGFTPLEAIHIATQNGAISLGREDRIGTVAAGKDADLVLIDGDPSADIRAVEKVDLVFKDGIGYDSKKLIESVRGIVGHQ